MFDWQHDRCDDWDVPDTPLNVYRRKDGQLVGLSTHWENRRFLIDGKHQFHRDCRIIYKGKENPDPAAYDDKTWITSTWTQDGSTVYSVAHNEYQGHAHAGKCPSGSYLPCWYNSIVLLKSSDGGESFSRVQGEPPIASAGFRYEALQGMPRGFFLPTDIVKDGNYFYTLIFTTGGAGQKPGNCLFRTSNIGDARAWEYWTGTGYYPSAISPYTTPDKTKPNCEPVKGLEGRVWSLRRHRSTGLYLATVGMPSSDASTNTVGISVSRDLKEWSGPPIKLLSVPLNSSNNCNDKVRYAYPSLIDLNSPDPNFSEVGDDAELYMTELEVVNCGLTNRRNLVRYRVKVSALLNQRRIQ